ncbi:phenylalanine--tRNA ligase subunit beta [Campylobacter sp. MIT 97-5078]|uniref:phenylalanine--tRNA ligase subunit beta n=1 Tax=Campylobacter sp. MIT 97-5078 TaxID=1548153 RepID=UPI000513FAEF|nr:phenylalanine--tRNA ligase subunit beta [Campylobacter sp. MIT 97-5078]KGI56991.1 phenylalanyl-tRNA synthetase subunit beta [Campylobacter sp. MIT 97-5078]TQR28177.1 phenylalanine--tRNA ligase subunit beta [Campylobacter sp. MIT 97-5078]
MILTKTWLNEFVDLSSKSLQDLVKTLNTIGIEVDDAHKLKAPDKVVVGFVKEKNKHECADKLNVCKVDVGETDLQIVCGASNVEAGQFVAVALVGAKLPNDVQIKKAKLRGVESCGMICSSTELGFAKINDGIMVLDESLGDLIPGKALNEYELFNDEYIEVELTPNRGDCLSIYGIARDLVAALELEFKKQESFSEPEHTLGIGRVLRITAEKELQSTFNYRVIELKGELKPSLTMKLRLATIQNLSQNEVMNFLNYATHSTGVIFNAYDFKVLEASESELSLKISKGKFAESIVSCNNKQIAITGIYEEKFAKLNENSKLIIIEASYTCPNIIAEAKPHYKEQDSEVVYRSFRGSEPRLSLGIEYLLKKMLKYPSIAIYTGSQQVLCERKRKEVNFNVADTNKMIGIDIDKNEIVKILQKLGFELSVISDQNLNAKVPIWRSDISNVSDICEEIVRMIGIDNIKAQGLEFVEKKRFNQTYDEYKLLKDIRLKAVANGYFESVHYVLDSQKELHELGFDTSKIKLVNPINSDLNALRSTLINQLLNAASFNIKNSQKVIKLFQSGATFDERANEIHKIAFLSCGFVEEAKIANKAKPQLVSFYAFLLKLKNIIGSFELQNSSHHFLSPYEQADIYKDGVLIGFVGRVHLKIEQDKDLLQTYVAELDLSKLKIEFKKAKVYSKFPSMSRDLSLLVPKGFAYSALKQAVNELEIPILESFRIVDIYHDESLKEQFSLSINFLFKSLDKTLEESEVTAAIEAILAHLKAKLKLELR